MRERNVVEMKKNGRVVLLTAKPETILERVKDNHDRPLLENNNILSSLDSPNRSNLHRMIRIYDFLEYGQKKTP